MNFKTTAFLLVLVLIVGGYFVFFESKQKTTDDRTAENSTDTAADGTPLFKSEDLSTTAVDKVTIERGGKTVELTKEDSDWVQTAPVRFPLDQWSTQGIINAAAGLRYNRKLEPGKTSTPALDKLGLAPPAATVTMHVGGDKPTTKVLKLGRSMLGNLGYVMVEGDANVYVVNDALHLAALEQKPETWRRKTLIAPTEGQAKAVTLTRGGETIQLDKHEGNWSLGAPHSGRADTQAVGSLLASITSTPITKFIDDTPADLTPYGLNKPEVSIAIGVPPLPPSGATTKPATQPAEAKPIVKTLRIGSPVDLDETAYFATWTESDKPGGVVFSVPKSSLDAFNKTVDSLRDSRLTPIKSGDVSDVVIRRENQIVHVARTPKGWAFGEPTPPFAADHGAVANLIDQLTGARATTFEQLKPGAAPAAATQTITITATGRTEPDVLHISPAAGEPAKAAWRVVRNNETVAYNVDHAVLADVFEPALALRDRKVLDLPADRIVRVSLKQEDGTELAFERTVPEKPATTQPATKPAEPGPWKLKGAEKFEAEAIGEMVADLAALEADKWLIAGAAPTAGIIATLETADGVKKVVTIDPKTRAATLSGVDASFEVSPQALAAISQEFRDRSVLPIAANEFKQVTIARGSGKSLTVHKDTAGRFAADASTAPGAAEPFINQATAALLFDALGNLRVEHYLAPRKALEANPENLTLTIETNDGKKITLESEAARRAEGVIQMTGALGERTFSVSTEIMKKLDADLTAKPKEKPPTMQGMPGMPGLQMPGGMED